MKSILAIFVMASLAAYGQKIETQRADRTKITRLATTLNHLSVIEFNEPVKEVAVGSSNFKVEWRENKVFVQPLEPDADEPVHLDIIWPSELRIGSGWVGGSDALRHR